MNDPDPDPAPGRSTPASPSLLELLEIHGTVWLAMARNCCGDHHFGEDALWEALHALSRELANGTVDNVTGWMAKTLHHRASERVRKESGQHRIRARLTESISDESAYAVSSDGLSNEDELFVIEEGHWDAIHAALPRLPPRQREVIRMRLFEKLSPGEIAESLGCTESAVHMAQSKAVKNLQRLVVQGDTAPGGDTFNE